MDDGSNGAISSSNKFKMAAAAILEKMAAAAILEKFQMAISPQRLTIYLYSAHRAVIFAIAQLSCSFCQPKVIFSAYVEPQSKNDCAVTNQCNWPGLSPR